MRELETNKIPRKPMTVSVESSPRGTIKVIVNDHESDSLVILEVRSAGDYEEGALMATTKVRGNSDAHKRRVQKEILVLNAPRLTDVDKHKRRLAYAERWANA